MGYTHYYKYQGSLPEAQFNAFVEDCQVLFEIHWVAARICYESDVPDEPPEASAERGIVRFNGKDGDGHETFVLTRQSSGFPFCVTARKPYDRVVTAVLLLAAHHFGDLIKISSDGDMDGVDWAPGRDLLRQAGLPGATSGSESLGEVLERAQASGQSEAVALAEFVIESFDGEDVLIAGSMDEFIGWAQAIKKAVTP